MKAQQCSLCEALVSRPARMVSKELAGLDQGRAGQGPALRVKLGIADENERMIA